jgi:transposase-like protein
MKGIQINNTFLDFSNTTYKCPYCKKEYNDDNEKYLKRLNKNKFFKTIINCTCNKNFYMTYDIQSDAIGFNL